MTVLPVLQELYILATATRDNVVERRPRYIRRLNLAGSGKATCPAHNRAMFGGGEQGAAVEGLGVDLPLEMTEDMLFDLAFGEEEDVFFSPMHYPGGPGQSERKLGGTRKPRSPPARHAADVVKDEFDGQGSDSGSVQSRKLKRKGTDEPDELYVQRVRPPTSTLTVVHRRVLRAWCCTVDQTRWRSVLRV